MATLKTQGIALHYELYGNPENTPVLLISGLGGTGASWNTQIKHFKEKYFVILPDQRGTGRTTRAQDGYTTQQLATDMVSLIKHLGLASVHLVGSSTGGAIAQYLTLDYPEMVRSLILSSSFARFDTFMTREFYVRKKIAKEWGRFDTMSAYALFLFSPRFVHNFPDKVTSWIEHTSAFPITDLDRTIGLKRIDMIAEHDCFDRLQEIKHPTFVLCGDNNHCTPLPLSEELAQNIPNAELLVFEDTGELIEIEKEEAFFEKVSTFIDRFSHCIK